MKRVALISWLICSVWAFVAHAETESRWLDRSHAAFVPASIAGKIETQADFQLLWWNFVVVELPPSTIEPEWAALEDQCVQWRTQNEGMVRMVFCGSQFPPMQDRARDWSLDYLRRHPAPSAADVNAVMNATLAKASLPVGSLVDLLRLDPFGSLGEMQQLLQQKMTLPFESHQGFLYDRATHRVLIPVQMSYPANESAKTAQVEKTLSIFHVDGAPAPTLLGAHAVTAENELQVRADLESVSTVSTVILLLLVVIILSTGRGRVLLIIPPLLVSMALAAGVTILVFGKIHGLCLAFGPAIVGLAIDFGLHVAFSNQAPKLWRANFFGLLTTLAVLVVMFFSRIPLLQQLMFFSTTGLIFGYLIQYAMFKYIPGVFSSRAYALHTPRNRALVIIVGLLSLGAIVGPFFQPLTLDMRAMNFETPRRAELNRWFYTSGGDISPLMEITSGSWPLETASAQKAWAESQNIGISGVGALLPSLSVQQKNLDGWRERLCPKTHLTSEQSDFFAPFFTNFSCDDLHPRTLAANEPIPSYLQDYEHNGKWLTLWLPKTPEQMSRIKAHEPEAFAFSELAREFPRVFAQELTWMIPTALLLAFAFLIYYYRSIPLALIASTPFFSGVGLYFIVSLILQTSTNFISVIGLIMVFGFSLDYGLFATDLVRRERKRPDPGIWSGLAIGTLANIAGFTPLVFGHHPVLRGLGETLLCGTIGTFLGSIGGIPGLYALFIKEESK